MNIIPGQIISAADCNGKVRDWTTIAVFEDAPNEGLVVADPHLTDDERVKVERVNQVNEIKKTVMSPGINLMRGMLELSEIIH